MIFLVCLLALPETNSEVQRANPATSLGERGPEHERLLNEAQPSEAGVREIISTQSTPASKDDKPGSRTLKAALLFSVA